MKSLGKSAILGLYKYSGAMQAQERMAHWTGRHFMTAVVFHRVTDAIPPDDLTVTTAWFRGFCQLMRDRFHVIPLSEMCNLLQRRQPPPLRTVTITFDDCYRDNLSAARVLHEHGLPATFFVPTKYVGTEHVFHWDQHLPLMANLSWDDVREMQSLGHEIGSHSVSHPDFGTLDAAQARAELVESKEMIENVLGQRVRYFAYPYGGTANFRDEYLALAQSLGYEATFSAHGGFIQPQSRGQVLPRQAMPYFRSLLHLEVFLTGCLDWLYQVKRQAAVFSV